MSANTGDTTIVQRPVYMSGGRAVAAERGWAWIAEGWRMFLRAPLPWILIAILFAVILIVLSLVPVIGPIVYVVLTPVFAGGLMLGCRALEESGGLRVGHLFAGFRERFGALAAVGAIYLGATIVAVLVAGLITGASLFSLFGGGNIDPEAVVAAMAGLMVAMLIMTALMLPMIMAVWFAAPLILFHNQGAIEAMRDSFVGCLRNMLPFLVYGVVGLVFAILACIPLMLGWLVLGPVVAASVYTSYRDIYLS